MECIEAASIDPAIGLRYPALLHDVMAACDMARNL